MNLLERMKHYNFWVALSMAVIILLNTLAKAFDFKIDEALINDIIMAILGILVVLGFVQKDNYNFVDTSKTDAEDESKTENESSVINKEQTKDEGIETNKSTNESENSTLADVEENNEDNNEEINFDSIIDELKKDIQNLKK